MSRPVSAPFACQPAESRGRLIAEPESATRTCFQRDRDRVIHSSAFRRLKYKTQVFVYHEGDYYRTRLSHSIEVAQIARSISRVLGLDEDLTEALALAHDLGHTPFGHAGEQALDAAMAGFGGFDHNEQTFRILTRLEQRYAAFDGLNLTWESLEGTVKHNGPLRGVPDRALPVSIADYDSRFDLQLGSQPSGEAQVAALSDDIAYNSHDLEDGLRANLFDLKDLQDVPMIGPILDEVRQRYPDLETGRLIYEAVRRMIGLMVEDLLAESRRRLDAAEPESVAALRALREPVVAFSKAVASQDRALKAFLFEHMYRHERVNRMMSKMRRVISDLFARYLDEPQCLPREWQAGCDGAGQPLTARRVADYIAGMTDRYALAEHQKLFDIYAKS